MGFIAWIRKGKDALHECAESIRRAEERKRHQKLPGNQPVEVRAVVSFDDKTVTDAKTQANCEHATQESIKNATWTAVVAATVYALITLGVWCQMIKQNHIASEAVRQSAESFRIDERAWIEIEPIKPTFISPPDKNFPAVFTCDIFPKNVGKTVARDVAVKAESSSSSEELGGNSEWMRNIQDKMLLGGFKEMGTNKPIIVPSNPVPRVLAPNSVSPVPFRLTCQAPQVFPNGKQILAYMIGRIDYCDQFQIKHWLKFCFYVVNARGEIWACREGNDEDKNTEVPTVETSCRKPN